MRTGGAFLGAVLGHAEVAAVAPAFGLAILVARPALVVLAASARTIGLVLATLQPQLGGLRDNPERRLEIEGLTDSVGSDSWNLALSQQRAESVRAALVQRGVEAPASPPRACPRRRRWPATPRPKAVSATGAWKS
ncbi:OmpA family protein [Pseudorhodoferax sp. Leaf265]|uniref:OmpA family protein n=1 Tax=Pseudorhodoferax sp. Leaf265 TaxID=1736315 RepID=UPI0009EB71C4|nr:OmpA family protein [Pseudorhodoferax sp. Leaf265]